MRDTWRDFTISRVAGGDQDGAMAWLRRRQAWENRLRDLERRPGPAAGPRRGAAVPVGTAVGPRSAP